MNPFIARYQNHEVHQILRDLDEDIQKVTISLEEPEQRFAYARFLRVVRYCRRALAGADAILTTMIPLDHLNGQVNTLREQHQAFLSDKNWQTLGTATDALLDELLRLPRPTGAIDTKDWGLQLEDYRKLAETSLEDVNKHVEEIQTRCQDIQEQLQGFDTQLQQQNAAFETQKGRLDQLISDEQNRFLQSEQARTQSLQDEQNHRDQGFQQLHSGLQGEIDSLIDATKEKTDSLIIEQDTKANQYLATLQEHEEHAKRIIGIIGNIGVTGNYQKIADREWKQAELFRWIAIASFAFMAGIVVWVVWSVQAKDFNWQIALFRVGVALALVAPAIYCARESSRHRALETRNRRIELELASLNPFLEQLPQEKVHAIIEGLTSEYFGNQIENPDGKSSGLTKLKNLKAEDLIKVIELLSKLGRPGV